MNKEKNAVSNWMHWNCRENVLKNSSTIFIGIFLKNCCLYIFVSPLPFSFSRYLENGGRTFKSLVFFHYFPRLVSILVKKNHVLTKFTKIFN